MEIKIQGWSRFGCDAVIGTFKTYKASINLNCRTKEGVFNAVIFSLPTEGDYRFDIESNRLFRKNSTDLIQESIVI
jgi:hypothetical protein